jgi:hypothetical protein
VSLITNLPFTQTLLGRSASIVAHEEALSSGNFSTEATALLEKRQAEQEKKAALLILDKQISRATSLLNKSIQNEVNNHENCFLEKEKLLDHIKQCISIIDKKSVTRKQS